MKKIIHQFTETGEVRGPKKNEYYINDEGFFKKAETDYVMLEYPILTYKRVEEKWKPKYQDNYFYLMGIDIELKVWNDMWVNSDGDNKRWGVGNCFPTKELAEEKLKQIKEILK